MLSDSALGIQFYRKKTFGVHRLSVHQSMFSSMDSMQENHFSLSLCFLIFFPFHLLWHYSSMHFLWRFILASCLWSLFLHSSGRQAEPLGFHYIMFCLFLLFLKETACCLPAFLASFSVYSFCCCTFSVWGGHYMRQWCVSWCVIPKAVSHVLTVQTIISVNLNNQLLPKMFSRYFFTLTAHHWTLSKWSVAFLCPGVLQPTLDRVLQLRP